MRRFISFILAVLVVVLSCIPCNDAEAIPSTKVVTAVMKAAADNDGCGNHHADLCSPFCTCSCCAGFAIPAQLAVNFSKAPAFTEQQFDGFSTEAIIEVHLPIWQPPKLG